MGFKKQTKQSGAAYAGQERRSDVALEPFWFSVGLAENRLDSLSESSTL